QKEGTKSSDNSQSPTKKPLNQLSDQELEKCLLEDFSRRLELEKYFVFSLGELKTMKENDTGATNSRFVSPLLSTHLTELTVSLEEKTTRKLDLTHGRLTKKFIRFLKTIQQIDPE
ncbi:2655_t:CDS:1, partial [Ambispora leptoticha]